MSEAPKNPDRDDRHARRRGGEDSDLDGREAASLLYGGPSNCHTNTKTPHAKGRGYYGCDLDEDGHCRRAGTEHCDFNCPHPSNSPESR